MEGNIDTIVRYDSYQKDFCITQCIKKLKVKIKEKENECLISCLKTYDKGLKLVLETYDRKEFQ